MSSVDGLISGMNTTDIIRQLMQLERQPVVRLQSRKATADKAITALQALNTKFLALTDLAKKLDATTDWSRVKSTSSHPDMVGVTATGAATPGTLSFSVNSLAAAHKIYSAGTYAADTTAVADPGDAITIGYTDAAGAPASLTVTNHDGTLKGISDAVNGVATSPVTARVVKTSDTGDYRLEFTAKATGASSAFTVSGIAVGANPAMAFNVGAQATDAEILFGTTGTPMSVKSSTNTMTGVAPGVTLTLTQADPTKVVTIDVARDAAAIADDVDKLVTAANEILKEIKALTASDSKSGLGGSAYLRRLQDQVLRAISDAVGGTSAATVGIELTRTGTLTFDKAKFTTAFTNDPAAVTAMFSGPAGVEGIAQRLTSVTTIATRSGDGVLTAAIDARRNEVKRIDDSLETWDVRLALKESRLRKQFAALEAALGASQQQGNWLAGQISSLPKMQ